MLKEYILYDEEDRKNQPNVLRFLGKRRPWCLGKRPGTSLCFGAREGHGAWSLELGAWSLELGRREDVRAERSVSRL